MKHTRARSRIVGDLEVGRDQDFWGSYEEISVLSAGA
jgi:hypothetical protein